MREYLNQIDLLLKRNQQLEKGHCIYIPHKQDNTDLVLGEYLNAFQNRDAVRVLFLRESEGVYRFGSRRVRVKVEHDN